GKMYETEQRRQHSSSSEHCLICLGSIIDKTILEPCNHSDYCFRCILTWTKQSDRCPLCSTSINHLTHLLTLDGNYERFFPLPNLPSIFKEQSSSNFRASNSNLSSELSTQISTTNRASSSSSIIITKTTEKTYCTSKIHRASPLDSRSTLSYRRSIYKNLLYSKHIPSNRFTGFRSITSKKLRRSDPKDWIPKITLFLEREFRAFELDQKEIDYRISYVLKILPVLDCKSEGCIRILTDIFGGNLDMAQLFAHELLSFLRSPFQELKPWDEVVQYPNP
ncbi:expressed protein, partial [Phakopsora pachyrhizi]